MIKEIVLGLFVGFCIYTIARFGAYKSISDDVVITYISNTCPISQKFAEKILENNIKSVIISVDEYSREYCDEAINNIFLIYKILPKNLVCKWLSIDANEFYNKNKLNGYPSFSKAGIPFNENESYNFINSVLKENKK